MALADHLGQRVERRQLPGEFFRAWFQVGLVKGIAAPAHLDEQGVDAVRLRHPDNVLDTCG